MSISFTTSQLAKSLSAPDSNETQIRRSPLLVLGRMPSHLFSQSATALLFVALTLIPAFLFTFSSSAASGAETWTGTVNGNWDTSPADANWQGTNNFYTDGNAVTFDDTATGTTTVTVSQAGGVSPGSILANNSAKTYSIGGNAINGTGILTMSGTGSLTLTGANTFSGGSSLNNGTVLLGSSTVGAPGAVTSGPLGTSTVTMTVSANSPNLLTNGAFTFANGIIVTGAGAGTANIGANTNASSTFSGNITLNNNANTLLTSGPGGTVTFSGNIGQSGSPNSGLGLGGGPTGTIILSGASTYAGGTGILSSTVLLGSSSVGTPGAITSGPVGTGSVTLLSNNNTSLLTNGAVTVANPITNNGATNTLGGNTANASTLSGPVTLNSSVTLSQVAGGTVNFTGGITGNGNAITTTGAGNVVISNLGISGTGTTLTVNGTPSHVVTLSAPNGYTGLTTVTSGTLRFGTTVSPGGGPAVQAYVLASNSLNSNQSLFTAGMDFQVNTGNSITISQLGVYAAPNNQGSSAGNNILDATHTVYIYNNANQAVLASINATAAQWNAGTLSADGYRFLNLTTPLTLPAGQYSVAGDNFIGPDFLFNANAGSAGTTNSDGGIVSFIGSSRYGTAAGYPSNPGGGQVYEFGTGSFVYNQGASSPLIPGDATVNGVNAVLDVNTNNGTVGTVTLAGGGQIIGTTGVLTGLATQGTGQGFQMQSGSASAILGGSVPLIKTTNGTVTLSGANTYSGGTQVNGGTLLVNNTTGSGTGSGPVAVALAGTLGGTGTMMPTGANLVTVNGTLAPGIPGVSPAMIGTLTSTGPVTFAAGSTFAVRVGPTTSADELNLTGGGAAGVLSVSGTTALSLTNLGGFTGQTYTIASFASENPAGGHFGSVTGLPNNYMVDYEATEIQLVPTGSGVVPEPSTLVLAAFGLAGFAVARWSSCRKSRSG